MFLDPEHLDLDATLDLFRRLKLVHLAASGGHGPVLRTVHPIVHRGELYFHGAPRGEKSELLGRPATMTCEDLLATIPSHWIHPERACPATSYFYSGHAHGVLEAVEDVDAKAAVLQQMMADYQPGGGHRPITAADPMYAAAVRGIAVVKLANATLIGRRKVGQNRPPDTRMAVMTQLWRRGAAGDLRAIDAMIDATPEQVPAVLRGPGGERFVASPGPDEIPGVVTLLRDSYWNKTIAEDDLVRAQTGSGAWVVARSTGGGAAGQGGRAGEVVGTARAITDGAKLAYVMDVCVRADQRGRGLGAALMRCLLDHPAVRGCHRVELHTRDAMTLYERLGFTRSVDPDWRVAMRRLAQPARA